MLSSIRLLSVVFDSVIRVNFKISIDEVLICWWHGWFLISNKDEIDEF